MKENKTIIENVKLRQFKDIPAFVALTGTVENRIDVCSDGYIVNGKSILGMYSIDLSKPFTVEIFEEAPDTFISQLMEYTK